LVAGALSLLTSIYLLLRYPRTFALKCIFTFGILVSLWEITTFLHRTASSAEVSAFYYAAVLVVNNLRFAPYLLTFLSIQKKKRVLYIISILTTISVLLAVSSLPSHEFVLTEFGWSYRLIEFSPQVVVFSIFYIGYIAAIIFALFNLLMKARSSSLRKKYLILLSSFVSFQAVGFSLTNFLFTLYPSFPPLGGVLNFLTFLFLVYAVRIEEEKIPVLMRGEARDFSTVYSSFLTILYNFTSGTSLGEESFKFIDFINDSGIGNQVAISENKISFTLTEGFDIHQLINRNLKFLSWIFKGTEVVDFYLRVLNSAYHILGDEIKKVVTENEDFLRESDLIYGIAGGKLLFWIDEDRSLEGLDPIDASLKIFKRILLPVLAKMSNPSELRKQLSMYRATRDVKISEYGEISVADVKNSLANIPKEERLPILIEGFNAFATWVYERILTSPDVETWDIFDVLQRVFSLNKDKANELNIYYLFLERLAVKVPRVQVQQLYYDYLKGLVETRTSELKEAQKRLLESERLAAIGETAGMVGHDLRNPLQVIFYSVYLLRKMIDSASIPSEQKKSLHEQVGIISEQAQYMNKIVSDLQDFAKPIKVEPTEVNLRELVDEALSSIQIKENIEVHVRIPEDFPSLMLDTLLMRRVFVNLFTNAVQAMPDGGKLTVSASKGKDSVTIYVSDTGVGIIRENLGKMFTPLFTTKAKGQGFGLAVCKRLVEAHGGTINVESEVGKGSTFVVSLPLERECSKEIK